MTTQIEAIYEQGVLRPVKPIRLAEGTRVEIILLTKEQVGGGKGPAEILAAIAALPEEGANEPFSGRDHDQVLYGEDPAS